VNCTNNSKCVWRPVSAQTRWGSYNSPETPYPLLGGGRDGKGKERVGNRERVERGMQRVGLRRDGKGRERWKKIEHCISAPLRPLA